MATKKSSMREIAAQAGVSVVAVSSALRGGSGVSETTRAKIVAIAESLGYRPDPLLSHLMYHLRSRNSPKSPHNIALLHWPLAQDTYRDLVVRGARHQAEKHGYHLDVIEMGDKSPSPRVLQRMLHARGIAGLILGPSPVRDFSGLLDWENYAVVMTSYSVVSPRFHRVVPNQFSATQLAIQTLRTRGYRRIGLLVPPWIEERVNHFHSIAFMWEANQAGTKPLICHHEPKIHPPSRLRDWFKANRPDALVVCFPLDYEAVLSKALSRAAVDKLGLVFLGYDTQCAGTITVDYQPSLLGSIAVDQLINQLHRQERGIPKVQQTLSVEGHWIQPHLPGS